jgi:hypothetical protein
MPPLAVIAIAPRCATCRHWTEFEQRPLEDWVIQERKLGLCAKVVGAKQSMHWSPDSDTPKVEPVEAAVEDLSDCCALRTSAAFGCVLHEEREP